jgi:hypothetical protein
VFYLIKLNPFSFVIRKYSKREFEKVLHNMTRYDQFDDDFAVAKFKGCNGGGGRNGKRKNKGKGGPNGCFTSKHVRISLAKQQTSTAKKEPSTAGSKKQ